MSKVNIISHPLIQHKLTHMRRKETTTAEFRASLREISMLMGFEIFRDLQLEDFEIETPLEKMKSKVLAGKNTCIVPILRAGLGFVDGLIQLLPSAKVGHIGLYRDPETLVAVEYYLKFPKDIADRSVIVVDPMLATGHSAIAAIDRVKNSEAQDIKFMCLIASPEGVAALQEEHPDVDIYTAAVDRQLNEHGYILPGIGDAGDRIFGTQ